MYPPTTFTLPSNWLERVMACPANRNTGGHNTSCTYRAQSSYRHRRIGAEALGACNMDRENDKHRSSQNRGMHGNCTRRDVPAFAAIRDACTFLGLRTIPVRNRALAQMGANIGCTPASDLDEHRGGSLIMAQIWTNIGCKHGSDLDERRMYACLRLGRTSGPSADRGSDLGEHRMYAGLGFGRTSDAHMAADRAAPPSPTSCRGPG